MNKLIYGLIILTAIVFISCNDNKNTSHEDHHASHSGDSSTPQVAAAETQEIKTIPVLFKNTDPVISSALETITGNYLSIKNALASDEPVEAAAAAKSLSENLASIDKSRFSAEQKSAFDKSEQGLNQHAVQITASAGDIKGQRNHFIQLSNSVYELVKNFGGGRIFYHAHCPMANNNKGALWISESMEIKNPYFGAEMLTCGSIEEQIQ